MSNFYTFCSKMSSELADTEPNKSPNPVDDKDLTRDMVNVLYGFESHFVKKGLDGRSWKFTPVAYKILSNKQKKIVTILVRTSSLYCQVKEFYEKHRNNKTEIRKTFISAIHRALRNYYQTIAYFPIHDEKDLMYILYSMDMHEKQFKFLIPLIALCYEEKGCKLISIIYSHMQRNKICTQYFYINVFDKVCVPLGHMLKIWLLEGKIFDTHEEFFVGFCINNDNIWNRYFVRKTMVPRFISKKMTKKILRIGKYKNFLRQICGDNGDLPGDILLRNLFTPTKLSKMFNKKNIKEFYITLDKLYRYASTTMLYIVSRKYDLFKHIYALKNYILMGNGEFSTKWLYPLYSRDRGINHLVLQRALEDIKYVMVDRRYEEDVFNRLHVSRIVLDFSGKKTWDLYTLSYEIDGPLGFIFNHCMPTYRGIGGIIWNTKNMEYILYNMWREQMFFVQKIPVAKYFHSITRQVGVVLTAMIHFINQMLFYFMCEVLDHYWVRMIERINKAQSIDEIFAAHAAFLRSVAKDFFLDSDYEDIMLELIKIYELQKEFENYFKIIYQILGEAHKRSLKVNGQHDIKLTLRSVYSSLEPMEQNIYSVNSRFKISVRKFCSLYSKKRYSLVNFDYYSI